MRIQKFIFCNHAENNPLFLDEVISCLNFSFG